MSTLKVKVSKVAGEHHRVEVFAPLGRSGGYALMGMLIGRRDDVDLFVGLLEAGGEGHVLVSVAVDWPDR
jgi:hypothetical protein